MNKTDAKKIIASSTQKTRISMAVVAALALAPGLYLGANAIYQWEPMSTVLRMLSMLVCLVFVGTAALLLKVALSPSPISTLVFDEPGKILKITTENIRYRGLPSQNVNLYIWTADNRRLALMSTQKNVGTIVDIIRERAPHAKVELAGR